MCQHVFVVASTSSVILLVAEQFCCTGRASAGSIMLIACHLHHTSSTVKVGVGAKHFAHDGSVYATPPFSSIILTMFTALCIDG